MSKTFLFQAVQFNQTIHFSISKPLVLFNPWIRILSGATTPGQRVPGNDGNDGVLRIPQSSSITGTSPSDCLVSYLGHSFGESYPSAEKQPMYSTAPADWANKNLGSRHNQVYRNKRKIKKRRRRKLLESNFRDINFIKIISTLLITLVRY